VIVLSGKFDVITFDNAILKMMPAAEEFALVNRNVACKVYVPSVSIPKVGPPNSAGLAKNPVVPERKAKPDWKLAMSLNDDAFEVPVMIPLVNPRAHFVAQKILSVNGASIYCVPLYIEIFFAVLL
tara:strand:- start:21 stop:398 length:378 start_codon:yes stop_codon:yes gene_type:complete